MTPPPVPGTHPPAPSPEELESPAGQLLERSAAATALVGLDGRITYVNPAFLALWGFVGADDALGKDAATDFWMEPDKARESVRALKTQSIWQGELTARTASGASRPVRATLQQLLDPQGRRQAMLANFVDIGAEHAMRSALESERQFTDLVFGSAGVLVAALDEEGRFIRFNDECARVSGYKAEEVLGRSPWETVLPPEAAPMVRAEAFEAALARPLMETTTYTNEWLCRDGERRLIEWTNRVALEPGSQRRFMVSVGVDVTVRRAAEQALARNEAMLRAAQAVARMGSWTLDLGSGLLEWSDEVFRLFEIDKAGFDATYASFVAAVHPDDRQAVVQAYERSLQTREPYRAEHRLLMPDGRVKWVEERCETEFDAAGRPLRSRGTVQDITERHLWEVELERFRLMVEHAPEEVWLTDEASRVVYANAAACKSLGYTREQLVGMPVADIDADGPAKVRAIVDAVGSHRSSGREPEGFRIRHRTADGRIVPKEIYAASRHIDGRRYGIAFARDITERLRAEQALAASEAQLRDALDTYPGWVSCVDEGMRYVYVNRQFAQNVGRPLHEVIGRTADEVLGPDGRAERWATHQRLIAGEPVLGAERRLLGTDGNERFAWIEYRASERGGHDGRRLFFAFATDITELRQTQRRLASVTQDMGLGMWELTLPNGELDYNDELLALVGFDRSDVTGDPLSWLLERIETADRPDRRAVIDDLASGRLPRTQLQMRVRHKQGHVVWIQEALRVISHDSAGRPIRLIGVAQDISALKAREAQLETLAAELEARVAHRTQALEQARLEAERANAAKTEFLSQMSHELRTPLNAIIGFGQLLEMSRLTQEDAEHVQEVMDAGRHLLRLIDEMLDLATVEAGRMHLRKQAVPLAPLVAECMRLLAPEAQAARVAMAAQGLPDGAVVRADAGRLKQVLLNLLSNAIKYNRRDGQVQVSVSRCGGDEAASWELQVTDTGAGLTDEQVERLFRPFERLGAERSGIKGTGIGLTLARRLTELMGGSLGVESRPGQGSTFRVRLPRAESMRIDPRRPKPAGHPSSSAGARPAARRHRVLYVEDNEANQRLLSRLLARRDDVALRVVATAREAVALAPEWKPALLLIDIQLPDGDGNSLLRELRGLGVRAPAMAISANAMPSDLEQGRTAGFARYLTKPLDLAQLRQVIDESILDGSDWSEPSD